MIKIEKHGMAIRMSPLDKAHPAVNKVAKFQKRSMVGPWGQKVEYTPVNLYRISQEEDCVYTYAGLLPRITDWLTKSGTRFTAVNIPTPLQFAPDLSLLDGMLGQFREGQKEMLAAILTHERCQLKGVTAMGKTFLIKNLIKMFPDPNCRIVIAAPTITLVDGYYRSLSPVYPSGVVTQLGGGSNNSSGRIITSTYASLGNVTAEKTFMVLADEVHVTGSTQIHETLSNFLYSRMYGFSASTEARSDGSNLAVESIFGRVATDITYISAVQEGYIPKIDTFFYRYEMPQDDTVQRVVREKKLIWRNSNRNRLVAGICNYWNTKMQAEEGTEPQILVLVAKVEHAYHLKQFLPEYEVIYSTMSEETKSHLTSRGLLPPEYKPLKTQDRIDLVRSACSGALRKIIATSVMGTGEDLPQLAVLVRADGGGREIDNIQFRGRVARGSRGVYCDIWDEGNPTFRNASRARKKSCERDGWDPQIIDLWDNHKRIM